MILVVDANVLVAELLRLRGQALVQSGALNLHMAVPAWEEARYELRRRIEAMMRQGRFSPDAGERFLETGYQIAWSRLTLVPESRYARWEAKARARIPRDPDDWPTVAVALELEAGIWTHDGDFLGCGCPTWTTETLLAELGLQ